VSWFQPCLTGRQAFTHLSEVTKERFKITEIATTTTIVGRELVSALPDRQAGTHPPLRF